MNSKKFKNIIIPVLIVVLGFIAIFPLSAFVEEKRPALPEGYEDSDLALQGSKLKGYVFGLEGLIADFYWMQSLQYIGNKLINSKEEVRIDDLTNLNPKLLYPYLENATTLDPHFIELYTYGAVVLPAIDQDQAIKILEKGIKYNPDEWRLYQHLGYIYWRLGKYEKASEIYTDGAKINGAAPFMTMMAIKMQSEGKSRETASEIYQQLVEQTQDKGIKEFAELNLLALQSEVEREAIDSILEKFKEQNGKCVDDLRQILPEMLKIRLPYNYEFKIDQAKNPVDPSGTPYLLDKQNCIIKLDFAKTKIPRNIK